MQDLFRPPTTAWRPVSPQLAIVRRLSLTVTGTSAALALALAAAVGGLPGVLVLALAVLLVAALGWGWWLIGRSVRRWGYAETENELWITRGALVRRLVVVPYGRMQFVDVQSGPLDRWLGIATVQLHTASPGTTAVIPGLPAEEAARMRDRLTRLGETWSSGL